LFKCTPTKLASAIEHGWCAVDQKMPAGCRDVLRDLRAFVVKLTGATKRPKRLPARHFHDMRLLLQRLYRWRPHPDPGNLNIMIFTPNT
jgi:hypothetical protein